MGHTSLDVTRRYARLTDKTREEEYFRAMTIIERGEIDGHYDSIIRYRRFLKRKNVSPNTVKNYLHGLKHFVLWLDVPIETVTYKKIVHI